MKISYKIKFSGHKAVHCDIDLNRTTPSPGGIQFWTNLRFARCTRCPLDPAKEVYCPVALDIQDIVGDFSDISSIEEVECTVKTKERQYYKKCSSQVALKSVMGLIMLTSSCPVLSKFRDVAHHHLPFSTSEELFVQFISFYLLRQYRNLKEGKQADFELTGLRAIWEDFAGVTRDFTTRLKLASKSDANLNAMVGLSTVSELARFSLEELLSKLEKVEHAEGPDAAD